MDTDPAIDAHRLRAAVDAELAAPGPGEGFDLLFTADERWLHATLGIPVDQVAK